MMLGWLTEFKGFSASCRLSGTWFTSYVPDLSGQWQNDLFHHEKSRNAFRAGEWFLNAEHPLYLIEICSS